MPPIPVLYQFTPPVSLATMSAPVAENASPLGPLSWVWSPCRRKLGVTLPLAPAL